MTSESSVAGHTPGPWHLEGAPYGYDVFTQLFGDRDPKWVGHVHTRVGPASTERERLGMYPPHEQCEANARLIAAAPELLDFARNVAGLDDGALTRADLNYFRSLIREWRDDARSIITKATGGAL